MGATEDAEFRAFARDRALPLRRLAYLLCGDWHLAEDLTQTALMKLYQAWPRLLVRETVDNYARQVLLRCWLDERRRPWRRSESRDGVVPEQPSVDLTLPGESSDLLRQALAEVPPRQRAAVVLRYWADLSVTATAAALGCSEGNVKSQAARGLEVLRAAVVRLEAESLLSERSA